MPYGVSSIGVCKMGMLGRFCPTNAEDIQDNVYAFEGLRKRQTRSKYIRVYHVFIAYPPSSSRDLE
jgi:hypothetical protein